MPRFRRFYQALARDFRVVRWDMHGLGMSEGHIPSDLDRLYRDCAALLDALQEPRVALVVPGNMGMMQVPTAVQLGSALSAFVLLSPGTLPGLDALATAGETLAQLTPDSEPGMIARMLDPDGLDPPRPLAKLFESAVKPEDRRRLSTLARPWEPTESMARLRAPTLVVHYPNEPMYQAGPEMAAAIAHARLVLRDGRGFPFYDPDLEGLVALIRDFVLEHADAPETTPVPPAGAPNGGIPLSPREREVIGLVAAGQTNAGIAEELVISPGTVARHVSNMLAKTGLKNRADLTRYAVEHGLTRD